MAKRCRVCENNIPDKAVICSHCRTDQRKTRAMAWKAISAVSLLLNFMMAGAILHQSYTMRKQTNILNENLKLEKRPYLYLDIAPFGTFADNEAKSFYVGAEVRYKNIGSIPANNIMTDIKIGSNLSSNDNDLKDIAKWQKRNLGAYPYITSVFPKQDIIPILHKANIGSRAGVMPKYIYIGVRTTYRGIGETIYSYGLDYVYKIIDVQKDALTTIPLIYNTYWDMDQEASIPPIKTPNWQRFKD